MGAPCKLRCSKLGKGTQQTSVLLKRHSITVRGATAKRVSGNTPKTWKPQRPRNAWRGKRTARFVRRSFPGDAGRDAGAICATGDTKRLSGKARGKCQSA